MSRQHPPILILMTDQQRADTMGCAGHPVIQTPNMDRLATEGMRFTNACTVSPVCMPARASFINGLYPHNHGMWSNYGQMPAEDETFFHHLQAVGYFTAHVGKSHYYVHRGQHLREHEDYMHARGLSYVHETTGPFATVRTESYMTDHWRELGLLDAFREDYGRRREVGARAVWPSPLPVEESMDSYIGRKAVEFIETYDGDQPVCLFVGFGGPHNPWDAPGEYATMYDPADCPPPIPPEDPGEWVPPRAAERMRRGRVTELTEADFRALRANYYGKITLIDQWFGEILSAFEQKGWLDDALIVFWSDHGEMAGDHGRLHKSVFYASSLNVPLIVRWPGHIQGGRTSDALTENIDVYPTLLEAVGAEPSTRCFGRSLWPVLSDPSVSHRDAVFSEIGKDERFTMIRTDRYKYALDNTGEGYLLYNMVEDPQEQRNLIGHPGMEEVEEKLRDRILRFLLQTPCRLE